MRFSTRRYCVLSQYSKPYTVDEDASKGQLGCALLQEQIDLKFLPVGY